MRRKTIQPEKRSDKYAARILAARHVIAVVAAESTVKYSLGSKACDRGERVGSGQNRPCHTADNCNIFLLAFPQRTKLYYTNYSFPYFGRKMTGESELKLSILHCENAFHSNFPGTYLHMTGSSIPAARLAEVPSRAMYHSTRISLTK